MCRFGLKVSKPFPRLSALASSLSNLYAGLLLSTIHLVNISQHSNKPLSMESVIVNPKYSFDSRETMEATMEATELSHRILNIIFEYALNKFDDTSQRLTTGRPKFLSAIERFTTQGKQVDMCLPAFPFKSANKVYKVFGILPDKAEELAMERLNTMCTRIAEIYAPGAKLTIISDGLVYNGSFSYYPFLKPQLIDTRLYDFRPVMHI